LAGGVGAIILPLIGFVSSWVTVHGREAHEKCISKLSGDDKSFNGTRWALGLQQFYFYVYVLLYFCIFVKCGSTRQKNSCLGVLFFIWLIVGILLGAVNIILTVKTKCFSEKFALLSFIGNGAIVLTAIATILAAVCILKAHGGCDVDE
jgi:hypothetical protein